MAEEVAAEGTTEVGSVDEGLGQSPDQLTPDGAGEQAANVSEEEPLYTVKINGREEQVTLDEALAGYSRQQDYTKKNQALGVERQRLAQLAELATALERNPQQTLLALAGALGVNFGPAAAPQQGAAEELEPWEQVRQEVQQLRLSQEQRAQQEAQSRVEQQRAAMVEARIRADLTDLHDIFGEFDDAQLMTYAVEHKIEDLGVAMRAFQFDQDQERRIRERNGIVASKKAAQVIEGGTSTAPGSTVKGGAQKMTLREAINAAMASI